MANLVAAVDFRRGACHSENTGHWMFVASEWPYHNKRLYMKEARMDSENIQPSVGDASDDRVALPSRERINAEMIDVRKWLLAMEAEGGTDG